ncbi:YbaB/EbfC family nucleoid-associated protein [Actinokineospora alba]|nr:YbaB/EbfC family nucleoid-associated protein [Actinokineospora alba]
MEQLAAQYHNQMAELQELQRSMREISCTAIAPRKVVSVTVAYGGVVKDVTFPSSAYKRMAPAELSAAVMNTIADAQQQVIRESAALMAPTLPPGVDAVKLFSGELDVHSIVPSEPMTRDSWGGSTRMGG